MSNRRYYSSSSRRRRRKKSKLPQIILWSLLGILVILAVIWMAQSCGANPMTTPSGTPGQSSTPGTSASALPTDDPSPSPSPEGGTRQVNIRAVGDIMTSDKQIASAKKEDGTYDFETPFAQVKDFIGGADLTIGNLETTVAGEESGGYTGYPRFNAPVDYLKALKAVGFDVLTTANNHCLDRGLDGLKKTIDNLEAEGFQQTGTARNADEAKKILMTKVNDVNIAIMAYTYGANGYEAQLGADDLAYAFNPLNADRIKADIKLAREQGAHVVILALHWGDEDTREPNAEQKKLAQDLIESGADIILGSHPHMLQPFTRKEVEIDGVKKEVFIVYSLSNFISEFKNQYSEVGIILDFQLEVDLETGKVTFGEVSYLPTWVHKYEKDGKTYYQMVSAGMTLDNPDIIQPASQAASTTCKKAWEDTLEHMGSDAAKPVKTLPGPK